MRVLSDKYQVKIGNELNVFVPRDRLELSEQSAVTLWIKPHALKFLAGQESSSEYDTVMMCKILNRSYQGVTTEFLVQLCDDQSCKFRVSVGNASDDNGLSKPMGELMRLVIPYGEIFIMGSKAHAANSLLTAN